MGILRNQKGSVLVEFAMVFCVYMAVILMLLIHGLWLYNNFQAERAARHAAVYLAATNNPTRAEAVARDYLNKTQVISAIKDISAYWSGSTPVARVNTEMQTFFPGLPKLLNPKGPNWVGKVPIVKEATTPGEHQHTNSKEYN